MTFSFFESESKKGLLKSSFKVISTKSFLTIIFLNNDKILNLSILSSKEFGISILIKN